MQKQIARWRVFRDASELRAEACAAILQCAQQAIAARDRFLIVLAGGSTPRAVYQMLRTANTDWTKWQVYFGDERCLPADDAERNSRMAQDSLLAHVPIPASQVFAIPAELGAEAAAEAYSRILEDIGDFDLVLLGVGEDGHTASLFPGHAWDIGPAQPAIPVHQAPKPPADRVSLSASRLSRAGKVVFLTEGAGKRQAVAQWRAAVPLPVTAIAPEHEVEVLLDEAAYEGVA